MSVMPNFRLIPMSNYETGLSLSRALWSLSLPENASDSNVTEEMLSIRQHPQSGAAAAEVPIGQEYHVNAQADPSNLTSFLAPYVAAGDVSEAEAAATQQAIVDARGGHLEVWSAFPPYFRDMALTFEEAQQAGWFEEG